jgi:hypothetical protein
LPPILWIGKVVIMDGPTALRRSGSSVTAAPWWLLTTSRGQTWADAGAGVLWLGLAVLAAVWSSSWLDVTVSAMLGVAVTALSAMTLATQRHRPDLRRGDPITGVPISRRGSNLWVYIRIGSWTLAAGIIAVAVIALRSHADPPWLSAPALAVLLTTASPRVQLRRPIVEDGANDLRRQPVLPSAVSDR